MAKKRGNPFGSKNKKTLEKDAEMRKRVRRKERLRKKKDGDASPYDTISLFSHEIKHVIDKLSGSLTKE